MDATDKAFCSVDKVWIDDVNSRGLGGPDRVSSQWVEVIKHPSRDEWAAIIPESYMLRLGEILTGEEAATVLAGFKTLAEMQADGWFE